MNHNLGRFVESLKTLELGVNIDKSYAMSLVPLTKKKSIVMSTTPKFRVNDGYLRQVGPEDPWTYLGVSFKGHKACKETLLESDLDKIGKAPLKPQQKLILLNNHLLPRYHHKMVLGCVGSGCLDALDKSIRSAVRKWLHLPTSVPNAYIHAKASSGGLSVPCLSLDIPRMRLERVKRFVERGGPISEAVSRTDYYTKTVGKAMTQLREVRSVDDDDDTSVVSKIDINSYWVTELERCVDTMDLRDAAHCKEASSFVASTSGLVSGHDYVHFHQIRAGCIPTKARLGRGMQGDITCRGCGAQSETNYHVIQSCPVSKGSRTKRHDVVLDIIQAELAHLRPNNIVHREPRLDTAHGLRIPDLVIVSGQIAMVVDIHIVGGQGMAEARRNKIDKYRNIESDIKSVYGCSEVVFESVTVSYKGIVERSSKRLLKGLGVSAECLRIVSMAVLHGSWLVWFEFKNSVGR